MAKEEINFIRPYEVVEGDNIKVKYRGYNGTQELATAANLAKEVSTLKEGIEAVLDAIASGSFYNGVPTLSWASTKYAVTLTLSKCTADNPNARVSGKYETTLTPSSDYEFGDSAVEVTMGGTDITATAWDAATSKVTIAEVTGAVAITATATEINNG